MTLKKNLLIDGGLNFGLWIIYNMSMTESNISFGISSFIFGAPFFLILFKKICASPSDVNIIVGLIFFYSIIILLCAFHMIIGKYTLPSIGLGNLLVFEIQAQYFSCLFGALGLIILPIIEFF